MGELRYSAERHIQNPSEPFDDSFAKEAIRSAMIYHLTQIGQYSDKLDLLVDIIFEFIAVYEFIRQWTQEDVAQKIEELGPVFAQFVEPLRIDGITLRGSPNFDLLTFLFNAGYKP